jgi:ABC-type sugar transport system ATPase subunit
VPVVSAGPLCVEGICFRIGRFALQEVSLLVRPGEYLVLTGPNGAGKTVLLKLIAGLHRPQCGDVHIGGRCVTGLPPWRRRVGYMPQDGVLFPNRTVRGNLLFGLEVRGLGRAERREAAERMAALLSIEHLLERTTEALSGGEQQKVSLGRALLTEPEVLLLDEPLSAIDEDARDALAAELRALQRRLGLAAVHVAHNRREIELVADRVVRLSRGRIEDVA